MSLVAKSVISNMDKYSKFEQLSKKNLSKSKDFANIGKRVKNESVS